MFSPVKMWLIPRMFSNAGFSFRMPNMGPCSDILQTNTAFCQHCGILQRVPLCTKTQLSYQYSLQKADLLFAYLWAAVWSNRKNNVRLDIESECCNKTALMTWGWSRFRHVQHSLCLCCLNLSVLRKSQVWDVPWWTGPPKSDLLWVCGSFWCMGENVDLCSCAEHTPVLHLPVELKFWAF